MQKAGGTLQAGSESETWPIKQKNLIYMLSHDPALRSRFNPKHHEDVFGHHHGSCFKATSLVANMYAVPFQDSMVKTASCRVRHFLTKARKIARFNNMKDEWSIDVFLGWRGSAIQPCSSDILEKQSIIGSSPWGSSTWDGVLKGSPLNLSWIL